MSGLLRRQSTKPLVAGVIPELPHKAGAPDVNELTRVKGVLATMLSLTSTPFASEGPLLVTVITQYALVPAWAVEVGSGLHTLVIDRSADAVTVVLAVAVLSAGFGSNWSEDTVTVLVIIPVVLEDTF